MADITTAIFTVCVLAFIAIVLKIIVGFVNETKTKSAKIAETTVQEPTSSREIEQIDDACKNAVNTLIDDAIENVLDYRRTRHYVAIDIETTGLDPDEDRIIKIAVIEIDDLLIKYNPEFGEDIKASLNAMSLFVNPGRPIPEEATKVNGITNEMVSAASPFSEQHEKILQMLHDAIIVGHNIEFDIKFLNAELVRCGQEPLQNKTVCTLKKSRECLTGRWSYRLGDLAKELKLGEHTPHDAASDAVVAAKLYFFLLRGLAVSLLNPPSPQLITDSESNLRIEESEWCKLKGITDLMRIRPYDSFPIFELNRNGVTYRVNLNFSGTIYSITYRTTYGVTEMTPRHKLWEEINDLVKIYNPTKLDRYSKEVEDYNNKYSKTPAKGTLSELDERLGLNGALAGHLKITSLGAYYFRARVEGNLFMIHFDKDKNFSHITYNIFKDGQHHEVKMKKNNRLYQNLLILTEKYNPAVVKPKKSSSI